MSWLGQVRSLVLGDTWTVPAGVAVVLAVGAVGRALAPAAWHHWGAVVLLAGVAAVLVAAVGRGAGREHKPLAGPADAIGSSPP